MRCDSLAHDGGREAGALRIASNKITKKGKRVCLENETRFTRLYRNGTAMLTDMNEEATKQ